MASAEIIQLPVNYSEAPHTPQPDIPQPRDPYEDSAYLEQRAAAQAGINIGPVLTRIVEVLHPDGNYYTEVQEFRIRTA